jgi:cell division protein FtsQ
VKTAAPLPLDIRIMNMTAALLLSAVVLVGLGAGVWWWLRHPMFAIRAITVQGEVTRNNAITLRANVVPQLQGNFFTLNLDQARQVFESVPWVRAAVVHRDFPNRLRAELQEHQPMALWGDEGANTLLNQQGQVFEANAEDPEVDGLPRLKGPVAQSLEVMQMYRYLKPILASADMEIDRLELSPRGSWRVVTEKGAQLELGRGGQQEVGELVQMFLRTLSQVTARYGRTPTALAAADLRHKDGYALRLKGVSTVEADPRKKP